MSRISRETSRFRGETSQNQRGISRNHSKTSHRGKTSRFRVETSRISRETSRFQGETSQNLRGISRFHSKISPDGEKDNSGNAFEDAPIQETGDVAYFSTLPIRNVVNRLNAAGYPAAISNSAGTYLCNNMMYEGLHYAKSHEEIRAAGFIHIPASFELAIQNGRIPGWSKADLLAAIELAIEECVNID